MILCLSGSRADYGYLKPVADALGVGVLDLSDLTHGSNTPAALATRAGIFGSAVAEHVARTGPSMMVVVGDRWETLSACQAAVLASVPIAHIGAGEETHGSYDQKFRTAIEALSDLPLCLTHKAYARLSGARVLAGCTSVQPPAEVPTGDGTAILAMYPETAGSPLELLLAPITALLHARGLEILRIGSNPDVGAGAFQGQSLPLGDFQARLAAASLIIGNSSAGIIEAPILCTPTVNIGRRQEGRPQATSVFDADANIADIERAISEALTWGKRRVVSPYYRADAVQRIVHAINTYREQPHGNQAA